MALTRGLHHVTAIAGDPTRNAEFYVDVLGLRLVKRTVNHDDKYTPHLYYGDHEGTPGTNITFFAWPQGRPGRRGAGEPRATAYRVPHDSLAYWRERLENHGAAVDTTQRFDETVLGFKDPDGHRIELVAKDGDAATWSGSSVPEEHQLRGLHGVSLAVQDPEPTADVLTDLLGYSYEDREGGRARYVCRDGGVVDVLETDSAPSRVGVGSVHHAAFRAGDLESQQELRDELVDYGLNPSGVIDRVYFRSVYAREPGGVLLEFATEGPGFTADESVEELGGRLVLPPWLEEDRGEIEAHLPDFQPPGGNG